MDINFDRVEKYRKPHSITGSYGSGNNGYFEIPYMSKKLRVLSSDGMRWDHVSVSLPNRCPTWKEMCFIKDLFFSKDETVVQFHPKQSEYVNCHKYCLHLWRDQSQKYKLPDSLMVGSK